MKDEYEVISHNNVNFHLFIVNLLYRTPHLHKDYEIGMVLDGAMTIITQEASTALAVNDIFLMNPLQSHEIKAAEPVHVLSLQVSPAFFASYYPRIEKLEFDVLFLSAEGYRSDYRAIRHYLLEIAVTYFQKQELYEIRCAALLNQLFYGLLSGQPHHLVSEKEQQDFKRKGIRMRRIIDYVDEHYSEKLLLSELAKQEELDLFYLSHFFKECFGISFQGYLTKIRCGHARQLLQFTDRSLLEISISCGFSDPKYFNKGFEQLFGCSPKEYRRLYQRQELTGRQKASSLTEQEFLSDSDSLMMLKNIYC